MTLELPENGREKGPSPRVRLVRSDRAMPFSDYRILGLVGQGQFAQVYGAAHRQTGQLVAIKQMRHVSEQVSQEPFVLNELCHPHIVCCQAIAQTQAGYQFVLDYCEAGTLRSQMDFIVTSTIWASARSLLSCIAVDILEGIGYIHAQQVIHGDLKPENILLTYQAQSAEDKKPRLTAKISDFGSARFVAMPSQSRKEIGSPTYAAPERFYGQSSYASDLYSAGVILYEMLLGDRPFSGSPDSLRQAHQTQSVPFPKSLSTQVKQFLARSLHKDPNQRFSSASEMLSAFQALLYADVTGTLKAHATTRSMPVQSAHDNSLKPAIETFSTTINETMAEKPSGKIRGLLAAPQGCLIVTDRAVYQLNKQGDLSSAVQLSWPSWIAIAPTGDWLIALPKRLQQSAQNRGDLDRGDLVALQNWAGLALGHRRSVELEGSWLKSSQASVVQVLAVDCRYVVRVLTSPHRAKSCLECFTRKGKLVGNLPLQVSLSCAMLALDPYQIVALSASDIEEAKLFIISLRPFQVHSVALSASDLRSSPRGIGVFSWGYAVIDDGGCLFLDRSAHSVGRLNLEGVRAIAPLSDGKALVAIAAPQAAQLKNSSLETFSSESSLLLVDLRSLNLDLVF